jgi:hypothetical protein
VGSGPEEEEEEVFQESKEEKINQFKRDSISDSYLKKNEMIYFKEVNNIQNANIHLIAFAGTNFCTLAPQYMPANPPSPNKTPSNQSGEIAISEYYTGY